MTDEQLKAKKWDMVEERNTLKSRLVLLESELKKFAISWMGLGNTCSSSSWSFEIDKIELQVVNPSQSCTILTVPWAHFDAETIKRLLGDIQQTKDALAEAEKGLHALGISTTQEF